MDLVGRKAPGNAVICMDPNLIGQERKRLMGLVPRLCAHLQLPGLGVNGLSKKDHCAEKRKLRQSSIHGLAPFDTCRYIVASPNLRTCRPASSSSKARKCRLFLDLPSNAALCRPLPTGVTIGATFPITASSGDSLARTCF